ncbi:hypothetical protein Tco_1370445 [Tanacetum coccineum]
MDIIAERLTTIQTKIRQVEHQKLQCQQMLGLFWEHPPALDPEDDTTKDDWPRKTKRRLPSSQGRKPSVQSHVGLDLVEMGKPVETVVRLPEVVEQKIYAYLELIGEELVVATLLSSKDLLFSESRIQILLERPSLSYGKGGSKERAVQGSGDIESKQKGSPFRTDYNKLTTLIERKGKLSALFACNAMPIKVGERFWLAVYYTKFRKILKLSREYQMLTITKNPRLKKKTPESAQGKIRKQENCTNLPPVTLSGLRRRRKKVWVQFLMKRSYSHSMDMLAFGMKMDEQALESLN